MSHPVEPEQSALPDESNATSDEFAASAFVVREMEHVPTPLDAIHGLSHQHTGGQSQPGTLNHSGGFGSTGVTPSVFPQSGAIPVPPPSPSDASVEPSPAAATTSAAPTHPTPHTGPGSGKTYLLVDGENIDATLGMNVLGRRPNPEERPRWDRINTFARQVWNQPVVPLFFLNASNGQMPMPFIQALLAMGYRPIPLAGSATEKVVDIGIQRTLEALKSRPGDVLLVSHDGDFAPQVADLLDDDRRVGLIAFREFVNAKFAELQTQGLHTYDLEGDVRAFTTVLPRVRIISLDEFDPTMYL